MKISAVILTKNEESNIKKVISDLRFCDEILVIDDNSEDKTVNIAGELGVRVIPRKSLGDFAGQRNFAMEQAQNDWILFVDADERVSEKLKKEIIEKLTKDSNEIDAYYLKRRDFWWGRELKYGEVMRSRNTGIIRLVRKKSGHWLGKVHEIFQTNQKTEQLTAFLDHYPHPDIKSFLSEINYYSTLRAKELLQKKTKTSLTVTVFYPLFKFILNYFLYLGFLDGSPGFVYAFMMSFHSFLVRAKLYQYSNDLY